MYARMYVMDGDIQEFRDTQGSTENVFYYEPFGDGISFLSKVETEDAITSETVIVHPCGDNKLCIIPVVSIAGVRGIEDPSHEEFEKTLNAQGLNGINQHILEETLSSLGLSRPFSVQKTSLYSLMKDLEDKVIESGHKSMDGEGVKIILKGAGSPSGLNMNMETYSMKPEYIVAKHGVNYFLYEEECVLFPSGESTYDEVLNMIGAAIKSIPSYSNGINYPAIYQSKLDSEVFMFVDEYRYISVDMDSRDYELSKSHYPAESRSDIEPYDKEDLVAGSRDTIGGTVYYVKIPSVNGAIEVDMSDDENPDGNIDYILED